MRVNRVWVCALALVGSALVAEDFSKLMQVVHQTWPGKNHIGVICDYQFSKGEVQKLADVAGPGSHITVMDVHQFEQCSAAGNGLANRQVDYMVLMPKDRVVRDGWMTATIAIHRLAAKGIPSLGTTERAIPQGAVFAVGDGTNGELRVNQEVIGTIEVVLPNRYLLSERISFFRPSAAEVTVLGVF